MKRLLYAGLLYLAGVAVILIMKPTILFTSEGEAKQFGIGKDNDQYTWLPIWLVFIVWAIISYIIILMLFDSDSSQQGRSESIGSSAEDLSLKRSLPTKPKSQSLRDIELPTVSGRKRSYSVAESASKPKKGFYILNDDGKYIYLGRQPPEY